jgi:ribosome-associated protein
MDKERVRHWLENKAEISFSRSSGPGGQNVNKVNSKSLIRVPLDEVDGLLPDERLTLIARLGRRLTSEGVLVVQAQDERSQSMNRELAIERVMALLEKGLRRPKPRRPTRPSRGAKERRLQSKKAVGRNKRSRSFTEEE